LSIEPLDFLFGDYSPEYWYWEIIETFRKVSLTGALVLVSRGTGFQIVVALVTTQLFIKLYGYYGEPPVLSCSDCLLLSSLVSCLLLSPFSLSAPFSDDYLDIDSELSQYQTFGIFFIALLIQDGE
jgi:hypothetical protein